MLLLRFTYIYTAIYAALKDLGFNPYHFCELQRNNNNGHWQLWLKAIQAKYDGLGESFKGADFGQMLLNYDVRYQRPAFLKIIALR